MVVTWLHSNKDPLLNQCGRDHTDSVKKGFQKSEKRKKFENVRKKAWAIGVFWAAAEELRKSYGEKAKGCGR